MTEPLASVSDLEARLRVEVGSLEGADLRAAELAIEDASIEVLAAAKAAGLPTPWTTATIPPLARRVVIGAALRAYRNPEGARSESFGGAYSYGLADDRSSEYLTAAEVDLVTRAVALDGPGPRRPVVGTTRTRSAYSEARS